MEENIFTPTISKTTRKKTKRYAFKLLKISIFFQIIQSEKL